jgi:DNA-binding transcriptional ArsR family regulator
MPIMDTTPLGDHISLLKTLADETRLRLIAHIAKGEHRVVDLANALCLTAPTISHHLSKLSAVGLLTLRVDGTSRYYGLDPKALRAVGRDLAAQSRPQAAAAAPAAGAGSRAQSNQRTLARADRSSLLIRSSHKDLPTFTAELAKAMGLRAPRALRGGKQRPTIYCTAALFPLRLSRLGSTPVFSTPGSTST